MTDDITNLRARVEALEVWRATTEAVATIHAIANWLDQQELHTAALRLRMELKQ